MSADMGESKPWWKKQYQVYFLALLTLSGALVFFSIQSPSQINLYRNRILELEAQLAQALKQIPTTTTTPKPCIDDFKETFDREKRFLCLNLNGGIGNFMFAYASVYGMAAKANKTVVIQKDNPLIKYFRVNAKILDDLCICEKAKFVYEKKHCSFNKDLLNLTEHTNYRPGYYFQSWKYFEHVADDIRKQFTFKEELRNKSLSIIQVKLQTFKKNRSQPVPGQSNMTSPSIGIHSNMTSPHVGIHNNMTSPHVGINSTTTSVPTVKQNNMTSPSVTNNINTSQNLTNKSNSTSQFIANQINMTSQPVITVGVHVRRGDITKQKNFLDYGYLVPPEEYFRKAMEYFRKKYKTAIFLVCSDDMKWCKDNIAGHDVIFIEGNSFDVDLAILSHCDHSIISVGTFGWWSAFLASGETIYFRHPARNGSLLRKQFSQDFSDFFYPGWIGMD